MNCATHIIIPVYNRREVTLANLRLLRSQGILSRHKVTVVDDGSTDGTSESISAEFPDVTLLKGSGDLYWTGAMEMGMRHAIASGADCCVWLNDDLAMDEGAIDAVVSLAMQTGAITSGQGVVDHGVGEPWFYPALKKGKSGVDAEAMPPTALEPYPGDTCRGNLVAIPAGVVGKIGYPDGKNVPHVGGDSDYGLRATAAGLGLLTLPTARFYEKEAIRDDNRSWLLGTRPLSKIWKESLSKRGALYPRMVFTYNTRHWGLRGFFNALFLLGKLVAMSALRITIPRKALIRAYGSRSRAYQVYDELEADLARAPEAQGGLPKSPNPDESN